MKKLLQKAELKIQEEMNRKGFIDDSDYTNRFLDNLALELAKEKYYEVDKDFETWNEFNNYFGLGE